MVDPAAVTAKWKANAEVSEILFLKSELANIAFEEFTEELTLMRAPEGHRMAKVSRCLTILDYLTGSTPRWMIQKLWQAAGLEHYV